MTRPLYIFDMDGTFADGEHRLHHIQKNKKDWNAFFAECDRDAPIENIIAMMKTLHTGGAEIWVWTGRSAVVSRQTEQWVARHDLHVVIGQVKMRAQDDHTNDDVLKIQWLDAMYPIDRARLVAVFEDRDRVVAAYRAAGVTCLQVAPGDF